MGKVISPLYRKTLSLVATVIQRERKDAPVLQLHPLSGSKSVARFHYLIRSLRQAGSFSLKSCLLVRAAWGTGVKLHVAMLGTELRDGERKQTCLSHGDSLVRT